MVGVGLCNGKLYERSSSCGKYNSAKTMHEEAGKRRLVRRAMRGQAGEQK